MNVLHSGTGAASAPLDNATIGVDMSLPLTAAVASTPGKARVAIDFLSRSSNAGLIAAIQSILVAMTGNASYPTPVPALADITAACTAFVTAVSAVNTGPHGVIVRKQKRAQLVGLVRSLALYVQQACNGDPAVLLTSGFPARKTRQPAGPLSAPANLRLARGKISGQLKARCNRVVRAGSYQWRYATTAAPTTWTLVDPSLGVSIVLEDLIAGTSYIVQVRAVGSQGPSDWSDSATLMVV